jgi:hypothetical protein
MRLVFVLPMVVLCAACESREPLTQPTAARPLAVLLAPPRTFSGPVPSPLAIGVTVAGVVMRDDATCATSDPDVENGAAGLGLLGPCRTFRLIIPRAGTLVATAAWPGSNLFMSVLTPGRGACCSSPLTLRVPVTAGSMVEVGVNIHGAGPAPIVASAPFELTTTLEPK